MSDSLHPVYVILFCNDGPFSRMIRKFTGSEYSHATITLDPSLNNMYSFSDIPYAKSKTFMTAKAGFVRESLWSPQFTHNLFFNVMITFVNDENYKKIEDKIEFFKKNYTKYKYNDIGLIQYYLNMKNTNKHDETKKMKWFCSEFVTYMLNTGNTFGTDDVLQAPEDLASMQSLSAVARYTIPTFSEEDLIAKTNAAKQAFIAKQNTFALESYQNALEDFPYGNACEGLGAAIKSFRSSQKMKVKEDDLDAYTALIDWKKLYEEFNNVFSSTKDAQLRFPLFEMILRRYLIPFKINATNTTQNLIEEMKKIASAINGGVIAAIDVVKGVITYIKSGNTYKYDYTQRNKVSGVLESFMIDLSNQSTICNENLNEGGSDLWNLQLQM